MMSKLFLLLAALLFPASLMAKNVLEMRYVVPKQEAGALKAEHEGQTLWLSSELVISDADVAQARPTGRKVIDIPVHMEWAVTLKLKAAGAARFDAEADKHFTQRLAILVNGKVISVPVIQAKKFNGTLEISGNFTKQQAEDLAKTLQP